MSDVDQQASRGWGIRTASRFEEEHIDALVNQKCACVVIPNFFDAAWCDEISRRFTAFAAAHPDHRIRLRPSATVDIAIDAAVFPLDFFVQQRPLNLDPYFAGVGRDRPGLRALYQGGADPLEGVRGAWSALGWKELPALEGEKPYQSDLLWGITGELEGTPHVDTAHELVQGGISHYTHRLNFEVAVRTPGAPIDFRFFKVFRSRDESPAEALSAAAVCDCPLERGSLIVYDAGQYYQTSLNGSDGMAILSRVGAGVDTLAKEFSLFV